MVDAGDLKSPGRKAVPVQVRPRAPSYLAKALTLNRNLLLSAAGAQGVAQNCPPYLHAKWRLLLRTPRSTGRSWGLYEAEDHLFPENTVPHRGGEQGAEAHRQA